MFEIHNAEIGKFARQSPENLERVLRFVCATIRQPLELVPMIMHDFDQLGSDSRFAYGWKASALQYYADNRRAIYDNAINIYFAHACPEAQERELLAYFAELPGLGLVKGAFVCQLAFGVGGCMDSHNMSRFDVNPARFGAGAYKALKRVASRTARVDEYCGMVGEIGGGAFLWDSWCDYVAELRPDVFENGFAVSELHVTTICEGHA